MSKASTGFSRAAAVSIASRNQVAMCSGRVIAEPTTTAAAPARIAAAASGGAL